MHPADPADHPLHKWQATLWLLLAVVTPLFVNFWVEQQFEASKVWLLRSLVWGLALLWLAGWASGCRPRSLPPSIRTLLIALVLVLALSTFHSANHPIALHGSLERANGVLTQISYLLLFFCVATRITPDDNRHLLLATTLTALPICLLALAQAAGWQPLPVSTDARSPLTTTLGRANFTGAYLALLLPLTIAAARSLTDRWGRFVYGVLVGAEILVIALTGARAAWIAAVVGIGVLAWLHHAPHCSRRLRWLSALGAGVTMTGALLLILQRGIATGGSIAARWTIWEASLRLLWPRMWLGYGADTLDLYFPSVYPPQLVYYQGRGVVVDRAHNWLLDWSLNYGIVATLIFLALVTFILWQGWQQLVTSPAALLSPPDPPPLGKQWVAAAMAAVCAQLVGNLFLFEVAATALLFWLLLAIVVAATTSSPIQERPAAWPLRPQVALMGLALFLVGWAIWQSNIKPLLADVYSWRGTQALHRGKPAAALADYARAAAQQPQRAAYHVAVALTAAQLHHFARAESAMRAAIALRPTDPLLYTQLAAIYGREGADSAEKVALAYGAYERAVALAPTLGLTYQRYADLALRSGDGDLAGAQAQHAVDLDATDGRAFGILGWSQLQAGNLAAAERAFGQAVRWQPDSADFYLGLATVYFQQGNVAAAREAVAQSLVRDPTFTPALTLKERLQEK